MPINIERRQSGCPSKDCAVTHIAVIILIMEIIAFARFFRESERITNVTRTRINTTVIMGQLNLKTASLDGH